MNTESTYNWCVFEAHQHFSILIEYVVLAAQILIFATLIYVYFKAKNEDQLDQISNIYKYIILWLIFFFMKTFFNILAYFIYMIDSPANKNSIAFDDQPTHITGLKMMSAIFFFLDLSTTFLLQNTMMYIPYLWMSNALQFVSNLSLDFEDRKCIGRIYSFLEIIKKYMYFRYVYIVLFVIVGVMIVVLESPRDYTKYLVIVSIIEALIILGIYISACYAYQVLKGKVCLNEKQEKNMFLEYVILLICNLIRIILNSVFYFSDLVHYIPDEYCYDAHENYQIMYNCIFLSIGLFCMHIIPGSMIMYVYWPVKKNNLRASLLISSSYLS